MNLFDQAGLMNPIFEDSPHEKRLRGEEEGALIIYSFYKHASASLTFIFIVSSFNSFSFTKMAVPLEHKNLFNSLNKLTNDFSCFLFYF